MTVINFFSSLFDETIAVYIFLFHLAVDSQAVEIIGHHSEVPLQGQILVRAEDDLNQRPLKWPFQQSIGLAKTQNSYFPTYNNRKYNLLYHAKHESTIAK